MISLGLTFKLVEAGRAGWHQNEISQDSKSTSYRKLEEKMEKEIRKGTYVHYDIYVTIDFASYTQLFFPRCLRTN